MEAGARLDLMNNLSERSTMIRALLASGVCLASWAPIHAQDDPEAAVELRKIAHADVMYVVHDGPTWGLGSVFQRVDAVRQRLSQPGPLFARYIAPNRAARRDTPDHPRTEIGFFVSGVSEPEPGFSVGTILAHEAATLVVAGPYGKLSLHHEIVYAWIGRNGCAPAGPLMEIYPPRTSDRRSVEIRVPVVRKAPSAPSMPQDLRPLGEIAAAGEYEVLAALVIPLGDALPAEHHDWVVDVIDRLRVIREIADKKYRSEAAAAIRLLKPIIERGEMIPRKSAAPDGFAESTGFGRFAGRKRLVLKDLDRLMVKAHLKVVDAEELTHQITEVLEAVRAILAG